MAAKKKSSPAFEFVVGMLKKNPKVAYADVRAAAAKRGYKIYPIVYGRAKKLLGMTKPKRAAKAGAARRTPARRGPGRPRTKSVAMDSLEGIIAMMKEGEREREVCRRALQDIRAIIDNVM